MDANNPRTVHPSRHEVKERWQWQPAIHPCITDEVRSTHNLSRPHSLLAMSFLHSTLPRCDPTADSVCAIFRHFLFFQCLAASEKRVSARACPSLNEDHGHPILATANSGHRYARYKGGLSCVSFPATTAHIPPLANHLADMPRVPRTKTVCRRLLLTKFTMLICRISEGRYSPSPAFRGAL